MDICKPQVDLPELTRAWAAFQKRTSLRPIHCDEDLVRVHGIAQILADAVGDDQDHPLYTLFELTMVLIEQWENEHVFIPQASPREVLRYLLDENKLEQKDLADIASPELISDILAGRREISKRLAKSLAGRFHIDIGAFV